MLYAYAEVKYDKNASEHRGRWVAKIHDKPMEFFIDGDQTDKLEIDGYLNHSGIYTFMVMFHPDDQFAFIRTAERVAKMREAELELHRFEPRKDWDLDYILKHDPLGVLGDDCTHKCTDCEDMVPLISKDGLCLDCHVKNFPGASFIKASSPAKGPRTTVDETMGE